MTKVSRLVEKVVARVLALNATLGETLVLESNVETFMRILGIPGFTGDTRGNHSIGKQ